MKKKLLVYKKENNLRICTLMQIYPLSRNLRTRSFKNNREYKKGTEHWEQGNKLMITYVIFEHNL